ncbi:MAG: hypothetical protein JXR76_03075 [Deltaproteobacteria bacterium]|nr:hypothetical protein [Deltaproteobacteria bacterium]
MMKQNILFLLFICSALVGIPALAQITDTDSGGTSTTSSGTVTTEMTRGENVLGLEPPDMTELSSKFSFSKQDCIDKIATKLKFTLAGGWLEAEGDSVYLLRSDVDVACDSTDDGGIDLCEQIVASTFTTSTDGKNIFVSFNDLNVRDLFGIEADADCDATEGISKRLWIGILDDSTSYDSTTDRLEKLSKITLDFKGPSFIPTVTTTLVGSDNVEVHFKKISTTDVKGFVAVAMPVSSADCSGGPLSQGMALDDSLVELETEFSKSSDQTKIKISGLENDTTYQVAVATVDANGNPSALSAPKCATPTESIGIGDKIKTDGEFCFIATAAFDSYNHPTVRVLRTFRDRFLRDLPAGEAMIAAYYSVGPDLASMIEGDENAKEMVRSALGLFAGLTKVLVKMGPIQVTLALWGAILVGLLLGFAVPRAKEK